MANRPSGLRFDIYERVHLQEGAEGIQELEQVELTPHIQLLTQGQQAILKGNLLLTGVYAGEDEMKSTRTLEHLIPVEITLPMSRILKLEDISVEIDNFDIDLLSSRSLNVTGVLSLHGIEMTALPSEQWREEEELLFVHHAAEPGEPAEPADALDARKTASAQPTQQTSDGKVLPADGKAGSEDAAEEELFQPEYIDALTDETDMSEEEPAAFDYVEAGALPEQGQELGKDSVKIAYSPLKPKSEAASKSDIQSLLQKRPTAAVQHESRGEQNAKAVESAASKSAEPKDGRSSADALEWKKLFLSKNEDDQPFRKLKICIVQKEESIQSIADKYRIQAREIQLYNRLVDAGVSEGQLLYIPQ